MGLERWTCCCLGSHISIPLQWLLAHGVCGWAISVNVGPGFSMILTIQVFKGTGKVFCTGGSWLPLHEVLGMYMLLSASSAACHQLTEDFSCSVDQRCNSGPQETDERGARSSKKHVTTETGRSWEGRCAGVSCRAKQPELLWPTARPKEMRGRRKLLWRFGREQWQFGQEWRQFGWEWRDSTLPVKLCL